MKYWITFFICMFVVENISSAEPRYFGYQGIVPGLQGITIDKMAIRSDGRCLFYSASGASSFQALDLLDMARTGDSVATNGVVFGTFLLNDSRLAAATSKGVQYYNVQYPYSVTEESKRYIRDTTLTTTVMGACLGANQQIYLLENDSDTAKDLHTVRMVSGTESTSAVAWQTMFGGATPLASTSLVDTPSPVGMFCGTSKVYVLAKRVDKDGVQTELWIAFLNSNAPPVNIFALSDLKDATNQLGYNLIDYVLSDKKDALLFLFNKKSIVAGSPDIKDSKVVVVGESGVFSVNIGADARALGSFADGSDSYYGFFVNKDLVNYPATYTTYPDRFLFSKVQDFVASLNVDLSPSSTTKFGKSGVGLSSAGARTPSLWVSSKSDHYKYGAVDSSGLVLISKAPSLKFVGNPQGQELTAGGQTLDFTLVSDMDFDYEMRVDEDADIEGSLTGLVTNPGKIVKSGSLTANQNTLFQLSNSVLNLTKNQIQSLMIFGRAPSEGTLGLTARTGLTFAYDPPPGSVAGFSVGFGDQSAQASFKLPSDGDIETILIHFSYDANDLTTLPSSDAELTVAPFTRTIQTGVKGGTLTSPVQLSVWSGAYVIAPIENGRTIYIRPQLVDTGRQYSVSNADAKGVTPYRTLTLQQALGSADSCAISTTANLNASMIVLGFLGFVVAMRLRFRAKKIGPSTSKKSEGRGLRSKGAGPKLDQTLKSN